jgi:hypothetical protein
VYHLKAKLVWMCVSHSVFCAEDANAPEVTIDGKAADSAMVKQDGGAESGDEGPSGSAAGTGLRKRKGDKVTGESKTIAEPTAEEKKVLEGGAEERKSSFHDGDVDESAEPSWKDPLSESLLKDSKMDFWYNNADIYMLKKDGKPLEEEVDDKDSDEEGLEERPLLAKLFLRPKSKDDMKKEAEGKKDFKESLDSIKQFLGLAEEPVPDDAEWIACYPAATGDGYADAKPPKPAVCSRPPLLLCCVLSSICCRAVPPGARPVVS